MIKTITEADYVIDLGPGAGTLGGNIIARGGNADLFIQKSSYSYNGLYQ